MSEVLIRPAHESELPAVGELTVAAYRADGFLAGTPTPYEAKLADARTRATEAELLVAVDGNRVDLLGTVTIAPPGTPWAQVSGPDELEFRMLAVAPLARGRGVGALLAQRVVARAEELGLHGVVLSSSREMVAAHRLYERMGFYRTPDLDWSPTPDTALITYRLAL